MDVTMIKRAAEERWSEVLANVGGLQPEFLHFDQREGPCPKCGGNTRYRGLDESTGALFCSHCFDKKNGDGIAAVGWLKGWTFHETLQQLAKYLGVNGNGKAQADKEKLLTENAKKIKPIKSVNSDTLLHPYCEAKPPITPDGIKKCGGTLVTWCGHRCIRFDGHDPIDAVEPRAVVLCRIDGKPFPAVKKLGERKTHTVGGSVNSWLLSGTAEEIAEAETILDVEGITDWLAVVSAGLPPGWVAVTNTAGAKARGTLSRAWARDKRAIVAGDADEAGQDGQRRAARAYFQAGPTEVLVGQLPYPIEKDHGKDLRDRLLEGQVEDLPTIPVSADQAAAWYEKADNRPRINASNQNLEQVTAQVWEALEVCNKPERYFRYGGRPSRIETGDDGEPIVRTLDHDRTRYEMARSAVWYKIVTRGEGEEEEVPASPPKDVVRDVLAQPDMPLPVLTRIVEAPVYAADGTLQTVPGYHPAGRTYYAPAGGFTVPDVPDQPTRHDIDAARRLVCDDMLGDFPFIGATEQAHAVSMFLLPFVREIIGSGATPIHLFEKPSPGTGATLLVDCLAHAAIGRPIPTMTECKDEEELRKRLTSKFLAGSQYMFFDNLGRRLDSPTLSAAVTAPIWEDRRLGYSEVVRVPVRCVWVASGNNPSVFHEISRRSVRIRLDARIDRPWLRDGFRIPDLRLWVKENRSRLVWAALVMIRAWLVAGRPRSSKTLGMFEDWAAMMGGILDTAGIPGFLENLDNFYEESDAEGAAWRSFILTWWERFQDREVKASQLWEQIKDDTALPITGDTDQAQKIRLGKLLSDKRDRTFSLEIRGEPMYLRIERGGQLQRAYLWKLANTTPRVISPEHPEGGKTAAIPGVGPVLDRNQPAEGNGSGHAGKSATLGKAARLQIEARGHARALSW